ncbi:MAG TPA: PEGA domain-containing protein [Terriglobales bacterium]|nr:PEGA domain-containing protein [Terriglobales bacterium]
MRRLCGFVFILAGMTFAQVGADKCSPEAIASALREVDSKKTTEENLEAEAKVICKSYPDIREFFTKRGFTISDIKNVTLTSWKVFYTSLQYAHEDGASSSSSTSTLATASKKDESGRDKNVTSAGGGALIHGAAIQKFDPNWTANQFKKFTKERFGGLEIKSIPAGAFIYVDGFRWQSVTDSRNAAMIGKRKVALVKEGFVDESAEVNIEAGKWSTLTIKLTKLK